MDSSLTSPTRRLVIGALIAALAAAFGLALAGLNGHGTVPATAHDEAIESHASSKASGRELRFHDKMRRLWEDHIVWTRLTIVSFAEGNPDLQPTLDRLLRNQEDIGDAIKPFYGRKAGNALTELLTEHINGAVDLLVAAKSGDQQQFEDANAAWYDNGQQIADFLHRANRRNWGRNEMRSLMRKHLDQTLAEGAHRLAGDYAADIQDYDAIHRHILKLADELSDGIIAQFPGRFD
ncbi:MAG: hypothetical protein ACRDL1_00575 [Solirubrobacterales bacterium]